MTFREASASDLPLLAALNYELIRDEGHGDNMSLPELEERVRTWLRSKYVAVLFTLGEAAVACALYRDDGIEIYLRQYYVHRDHRRCGLGREGMNISRSAIWPTGRRLTVDVLAENVEGLAFWRSVGYRDYAVKLEILPT